MSDDTPTLPERIERAVHEHLADTGGGMVTGWYFIADFIDADGKPSWIWAAPDEQTQSTTLGLLAWAKGVADYEQRRYLEEEED